MQEKPDLHDNQITAQVEAEYGLAVTRLIFLPIGADTGSAVYRVETQAGRAYFLKLRRGVFDEATVVVPQTLHRLGVHAIIPPIQTQDGRGWAELGAYKTILYPFIDGKDGWEVDLTDRQRVEFGAALRSIHTAPLPPSIRALIQRESYSPIGRELVKTFQAQVETTVFAEPIAAQLAEYMRGRRAAISHLVRRAGELARTLQDRTDDLVLCHTDVHAGNLLLGAGDDLYIVDWDNPLLAPKERDLMFIGGGVDTAWRMAHQEALFYQGYGETEIDVTALAYYRYERIVQDMAVECQQLFLTDGGEKDRQNAYRYFVSNFAPGGVIDIALLTDRLIRS